ncbi:MAG: 4-(cytidine 5'-diphospho)-2-C-methyl-D-erythritol kinase, partial [Pyrinomonadaceae bacterium]
MPTPAFSLPSFAKINWNLRILGRRPDGYHEVRTFLQTISLQDQLHFESRDDDDISLACDNPNIPTDETNLIVRAANSLRSRYGVKSGASIALNKRIPAKGGLGGASSNAAIALMGLIRLWRLELNSSDLVDIAAGLGAD